MYYVLAYIYACSMHTSGPPANSVHMVHLLCCRTTTSRYTHSIYTYYCNKLNILCKCIVYAGP